MKIVPLLTLLITFHLGTTTQMKVVLNSSTDQTLRSQVFTEIKNDSTSNNTAKAEAVVNEIQLNGESNTVTILQDREKSDSAESIDPVSRNTVKINGKNNSVNISQPGKGGKTTIQQNGNSNRVNVIQHKVK